MAAAILIARGPPTGDAARRVIITGGDVLQLRAGFTRTWQREPTADELRGRYEEPGSPVQMVVPRVVVDDLVETMFAVRIGLGLATEVQLVVVSVTFATALTRWWAGSAALWWSFCEFDV